MTRTKQCFWTVLSLGTFMLGSHAAAETPADQLIEFQYQVKIPALKAEDLPLQVMIPLAPSNEQQTVLTRNIEADAPEAFRQSQIRKEPSYGNEFWAWTIEKPRSQPTTVTVQYKLMRHAYAVGPWEKALKANYEASETEAYQRYLEADRRVPVSGELVDKLRREIPKSAVSPMLKARAIYNYVINNMEYKKIGSGWGNGDTYWACSQKYGNCTDFHALLTSMARAEGIPAKFSIGFPIPSDKKQGEIAGYHCWLELYLPKLGWMPVDASEAKKHPELREKLFGAQPADRILFSVGRDLKLPGMQDEPLNYFIYPHVEKKGKSVKDFVTTQFHYRILDNGSGV